MRSFRILIALLVLSICALLPIVSPSSAQSQKRGENEDEEVIKINSEVVLVNVLVTDLKNRFVGNLSKGDFEIFEDGKKQELSFFAKQDEPLSLGMLIDASTSMIEYGKLIEAKKAVRAMISSSNQKDEIFIMKFDDNVSILQDFTSDFDLLSRQVDRIKPFGGTAIYDSLIYALKHSKANSSRLRQALLIVTDGLDFHSKSKFRDVVPLVQASGIPCYFVGLYTPEELRTFERLDRIPLDNGETVDNPMKTLKELADETSGRAFFPSSERELVPIALQIVNELRSSYSLGYYPPASSLDGAYHRISVGLKSKQKAQNTIRNRRGYISKAVEPTAP